MTTQIEELVWHKYPDEKPDKLATCLRSLRSTKKKTYKIVDWCRWLSGGWYEKEHDYPIEFETVAWAYLPKGWQE